MLSAATSAKLLQQMALGTGHQDVDAVINGVVQRYKNEILELLLRRDALLNSKRSPGLLADECLEVLSELAIAVDDKLSGL